MREPDIFGWSEEQIADWEAEYEQYATIERADAAMEAWNKENLTPEIIAESEFWAEEYSKEVM